MSPLWRANFAFRSAFNNHGIVTLSGRRYLYTELVIRGAHLGNMFRNIPIPKLSPPAYPRSLHLCFHLRDDVDFNKFVHDLEAESMHRGMTNARCNRIVVVTMEEGRENADGDSLEVRGKGWHSETFASIEEFLIQPPAAVPSCLILHVSQNCNSLQLLKRFAVERPEMPIIVIAPCGDVRMAVQAMKAGAIEFLTKHFSDDLLLSAVRQALERSRVAIPQQAEMRALKECYATLTLREQQVMALVVSGMLNKEVGGELGISEVTVKTHRGKMMQKMKANSLAELVRMAAQLHLPVPKCNPILTFDLLSSPAVA